MSLKQTLKDLVGKHKKQDLKNYVGLEQAITDDIVKEAKKMATLNGSEGMSYSYDVPMKYNYSTFVEIVVEAVNNELKTLGIYDKRSSFETATVGRPRRVKFNVYWGV